MPTSSKRKRKRRITLYTVRSLVMVREPVVSRMAIVSMFCHNFHRVLINSNIVYLYKFIRNLCVTKLEEGHLVGFYKLTLKVYTNINDQTASFNMKISEKCCIRKLSSRKNYKSTWYKVGAFFFEYSFEVP